MPLLARLARGEWPPEGPWAGDDTLALLHVLPTEFSYIRFPWRMLSGTAFLFIRAEEQLWDDAALNLWTLQHKT